MRVFNEENKERMEKELGLDPRDVLKNEERSGAYFQITFGSQALQDHLFERLAYS